MAGFNRADKVSKLNEVKVEVISLHIQKAIDIEQMNLKEVFCCV